MICNDVRELMLEVDLAELRGQTDTPVARHLAECSACRSLAMEIVNTESALSTALDSMSHRTPVMVQRPRRSWKRWVVWLPAAAAAILVAIFVRGRSDIPVGPPLTFQTVDTAPVVETSGNQNVAVFNTNDPNIVVVWFLGETD